MRKLESFLKDGKHTLQVIEDINDKIRDGEMSLDGVALVSLDVEAMYNNMTSELARVASSDFLSGGRYGDQENMKVRTESILKALDLCLNNNLFSFNEKFYQQVGGVGTGVKLAPPYACLGMGKFEETVFNANFDLLDRILLWKRFIDDILMLFRGSKQECQELVNWLNSLHPGVIKFKHEYSTEKVEFLDLVISKENERLETNLYIKPCNKQLYLDFNSNHPQPCKEGIVLGQALRVLERCSKKEDSEEHLQNLESKLKKRNYPEKLIKTKFSEAKKRNRNSLIHQGRHQKSGDDKKVRLLFTNNRGNPPLHQWFREAKKCLVKDDRAKALGDNFQICYRQPKNLKSIVTHRKKPYSTDDEPGCTKCGKCKVSCPVIVEGGKFTSTNTRKTYPIRKKCRGQYVGKSETLFNPISPGPFLTNTNPGRGYIAPPY